jgi:hypothetical protein
MQCRRGPGAGILMEQHRSVTLQAYHRNGQFSGHKLVHCAVSNSLRGLGESLLTPLTHARQSEEVHGYTTSRVAVSVLLGTEKYLKRARQRSGYPTLPDLERGEFLQLDEDDGVRLYEARMIE